MESEVLPMTTQATTHASQIARPGLLRYALRADAILCMAAGAIGLADARPLAALLGIPSPLALGILGAIVLLYGALLLYSAARAQVSRRIAVVAIVLDAIWVIDSAVLLLLAGWLPLTSAGMWTLGLMALAVAML